MRKKLFLYIYLHYILHIAMKHIRPTDMILLSHIQVKYFSYKVQKGLLKKKSELGK